MPRKNHWSDGGAVGTVMTPLMVQYVTTLTHAQDSQGAARALGKEKVQLVTMVRYIEQKIHRRLFERYRGRGNSTYTPLRKAAEFFDWCDRHPQGGADWPRAQ